MLQKKVGFRVILLTFATLLEFLDFNLELLLKNKWTGKGYNK